jgi:putative RNA 2'-phosphotransferase
MHRRELQTFAKFLHYVLGVRPDEFGLVPDPDGFVSIKELLQAIREEEGWSFVGRGHIQELMHGSERGRFETAEDRIRDAAPSVVLAPEPLAAAPPRLFHGVRTRAYPVVMRHGLRPARGPWVVLSVTREMAARLARRRGPDSVILEIHAGDAARRGVRFYGTQGLLFLAASVPPACLSGPPLRPDREPNRTPKPAAARPAPPPGSFFPELGPSLPGQQTRWVSKDKETRRRERRRRERS